MATSLHEGGQVGRRVGIRVCDQAAVLAAVGALGEGQLGLTVLHQEHVFDDRYHLSATTSVEAYHLVL